MKKQWGLTPDTPVQYLKGVGEGRAALLHAADLARRKRPKMQTRAKIVNIMGAPLQKAAVMPFLLLRQPTPNVVLLQKRKLRCD